MSVDPAARRWRGAEITVSDSRRGVDSDDRSGDVIVARFALLPADVIERSSVADDIGQIRSAVRHCAGRTDVIILTGGTGLGPRDVTPQALLPMLDYEVPGMAEVMRQQGLQSTPHAMLSRQVVGVIDGCLVLSLPGNPRAVAECLDAVWPALPHALNLLAGNTRHHDVEPPPPAV
ncbi:MAG TPA: MogA/MoaB family molybdenum cofactor biosynthesis protein [Candidatus Acidoferrales bacterium]|nr:MogA/MoaB family molybdenum cofactor biosynthesis protein [Candidatus Acidoferrales bacterium]